MNVPIEADEVIDAIIAVAEAPTHSVMRVDKFRDAAAALAEYVRQEINASKGA